jgi:hypothetical protein
MNRGAVILLRRRTGVLSSSPTVMSSRQCARWAPSCKAAAVGGGDWLGLGCGIARGCRKLREVKTDPLPLIRQPDANQVIGDPEHEQSGEERVDDAGRRKDRLTAELCPTPTEQPAPTTRPRPPRAAPLPLRGRSGRSRPRPRLEPSGRGADHRQACLRAGVDWDSHHRASVYQRSPPCQVAPVAQTRPVAIAGQTRPRAGRRVKKHRVRPALRKGMHRSRLLTWLEAL